MARRPAMQRMADSRRRRRRPAAEAAVPERPGDEIERLGREVEGWRAPVPRGRYLALRASPARWRRPSSVAAAAAILILVTLATATMGTLLAPPALRATLVRMVTRERPPVPEPTRQSPTPSLLAPAAGPATVPKPASSEPTRETPQAAPEPSVEPSPSGAPERAPESPTAVATPMPETGDGHSPGGD